MRTRQVKIRILDEANAVLVGLDQDHIEYFHHHYQRKAPNYFFHPKYQLGAWDGNISYFYKTGKTYVNLLDEIVPKLVALKYKVDIEDLRHGKFIQPPLIDKDHFADIVDPETGESIELRPYQVEGVNSLIKNGGGILKAGTGSGKTIMNAALVDAYAKKDKEIKTITIVPNTDLVEQTRLDFKYWGLDVGEYSGDCKDINHTHVISTWQALQNNYRIITEFNLVVIDECFDENTKILMADGTTKKIKNVVEGDQIISYNIENQQFETDIVIKQHQNLIKSSSEDMYKLEFDNGIIVEVTGNHKILTKSGYVRADKLTEHDEIITFVY